jgi:prepilin-type N-terminal cleavage/methylation domain-containing protein
MLTALRSRRWKGFTLIEIMLVVAILAMLATLAIPNYLRARKRTQAVRMLDDLKAVDQAIDLYSAEYHKSGNEMITDADVDFLRRYLKERILLYQSLPNDLFGNEIVMTDLKSPPRVNATTFNALSDVAPLDFWRPYTPVE